MDAVVTGEEHAAEQVAGADRLQRGGTSAFFTLVLHSLLVLALWRLTSGVRWLACLITWVASVVHVLYDVA